MMVILYTTYALWWSEGDCWLGEGLPGYWLWSYEFHLLPYPLNWREPW